jgi:hypothetical protein
LKQKRSDKDEDEKNMQNMLFSAKAVVYCLDLSNSKQQFIQKQSTFFAFKMTKKFIPKATKCKKTFRSYLYYFQSSTILSLTR